MRVSILCESMPGNTADLAEDVMEGLLDLGATVALADATSVPAQVLPDCGLLVLAAPTHALTLSRPTDRAEAVRKGADPVHALSGLREWLTNLHETIPATTARPSVAVFDTRVRPGHLPRSAAQSVERALKRLGFQVVSRASFSVESIAGLVTAGEHERAREWGRVLADLVPLREATSEVPLPFSLGPLAGQMRPAAAPYLAHVY